LSAITLIKAIEKKENFFVYLAEIKMMQMLMLQRIYYRMD